MDGNALPRPQALPGPFSALPSASSYSSKAQGLYEGPLLSNEKKHPKKDKTDK